MTFTGIKTEFAIPSNLKEQQYPAIQVTNYRPQTLQETIHLCLSENSLNLLNLDNNSLQTEIIECIYNRDKVLMHQIVSDVRFVFLNIPRIFLQDKTTKEVSLPQKGVKLFGTNKVTIAKCFLACLVNNELVFDMDGLPQIFTLKLTSSKTQLIGNLNQSTEDKTIYSLNKGIQKHFKTKDNLVHLVSVELQAKVKEFVSERTKDSSLGVNFELVGNAKPLTEQQQQQVFNLVSDEEIIKIMEDPFGLKQNHESNSGVVEPPLEDIEF